MAIATSERETGSLIGSDKVEGTAVYGSDTNKIGTIERVMIDKSSGQAKLRRPGVRRIFGNRRRSLSTAMAVAEI